MENWSNFYYLCGSSAAGLTGLMFIAVTFGSKLVTKDTLDRVNVFLTPICFHFIQVFLLCCVASAPSANSKIMSLVLVCSGILRIARMPKSFRTVRQTAREDSEIEFSDWVLTLILPATIYTILIAAGIFFIFDEGVARNIFALGLISLLTVGIWSAWEMLIWLATKVDEPPPG